MTDPIADMLTRIRNASKVKKPEVVLPYSKLKFIIIELLQKEGYIASAQKTRSKTGRFDEIKIVLKYDDEKESAICFLKRISTPGRRLYVGHRDMSSTLNRRGITILSTPQGVMTSREAYKRKLGGEVICEIY